jgi:hypothetical protein
MYLRVSYDIDKHQFADGGFRRLPMFYLAIDIIIF